MPRLCKTYLIGFVGLAIFPLMPAHVGAATLPEPPAPATQSAERGVGAGDWLVRLRLADLFAVDEASSLGLIGGRIHVPSMILPDFEVAYFFTDHVSVEGQAGAVPTHPRIVGSMIGDFNVGTIWSAAASASVQYHFLPNARLNPYLGVGVSYSDPFSTKPAANVANFTVQSQTSALFQAGVDYHIAGNWFGNVAAKYMLVPEQTFRAGNATFKYDSNIVFVGAGVGYRF